MRRHSLHLALGLNALLWMPMSHALNLPIPAVLPTPLNTSAVLPPAPSPSTDTLASFPGEVSNQAISATGLGSATWQVLPQATLQPLQNTTDQFFSRDLDGRPLINSAITSAKLPKTQKAILGTPCFVHAGGLGLALNFDEIPRQQSIDLAETTLITVCPPGYRFRYTTTINQLATRTLPGTLGKTQAVVLELMENGGTHVEDRIHVGTGKPEAISIFGRLSTLRGDRFQAGALLLDPSAQLKLTPEQTTPH